MATNVSNEAVEQTGVVVGWNHHDLGGSIDLRMQSAVSRSALEDNRIDSFHFLMTRNQAMLLAKYLLDATGQTLPKKAPQTIWQRLTSQS